MKALSIRSVLQKDKSSKSQNDRSPSSSLASSVTSLSSNSSSSIPLTPTSDTAPHQMTRGIFRTLEAIWYYHSSLDPRYHGPPTWLMLDDEAQHTLEASLGNVATCSFHSSILGSCNLSFVPIKKKKYRLGKKDKNSSSVSLGSNQQIQTSMQGQTLEFNQHIRRTVAPVWWYEDDLADGSKGMCRFDYKNQVRLEALSDDRSKLVLTDHAFPQPFTVVLDTSRSRVQREEWLGFMYMNPMPTAQTPLHGMAHLAESHSIKPYGSYLDIAQVYHEEQAHDATLMRRCSV
ncbi:uncharacterized protein BYT42DRAFT_576498 [Radiomyces spectabilis]|uniref:uncharacterized protein n=1 Tax=Radiomyces spectabilis TaxID=64574 RepID=UPI00221E6161|nr:uncharacterized protein BYT42DRAFT_576498 [Radiomyces spectabilis]KAI8374476.1 hypothetical protein BYT42DRAFT_576498 [Radiomyces spectabilis]